MAQIDLMEVAEATAVESAILWQVQTILEALLPTGELDAWLHGVGLAGAIGELKSEVERMETVINGVKGRAVGNKPLARSLARVKELMYDADDVDTWWMSSTLAGSSNRSKEVAAIEQEGMVGDGAEQVDASANTVDTQVRTSGSHPRKLYGRDTEKDYIMRVIEAAKSDIITLLPIVGIVGVGKTALAKLVYNDRHVKHQFEHIWVWVSNIFDEVRVIIEILDVITLNSHEGSPRTKESYEGVSNYTKLQEVLKNHMACQPKKFLLVLDDVNDSMDDSRWKDLLDALVAQRQCFLFCSIFPNGYLFHIDDLVYMWISSGFVKSIEVGQDYLNALVNSGFLEHVETKDSILHHQKYYVMCGIMHEFARLVSRAEFATMDGLECKEVLSTVRHFSILIDSVYHEDECGIILHNGKFEEKLKSIISLVRGLRTLILIGDYDSLFFQSFQTFICSLVNCAHLRYLKLENKWSNEALPISLSNFYHLKVLDARQPVIIDGMSDHVSIRKLVLTKGACCACSPSWSACLQTIRLEDRKGWEILPSLERLSFLTKLKLRNMLRVTELLIPSLKELVLIDMPKLERCFPNSVRDLNSSLRVLEIRRCWVLKAFPLFESCEKFEIEKSWLPNVSELTIHGCLRLMRLGIIVRTGQRCCKVTDCKEIEEACRAVTTLVNIQVIPTLVTRRMHVDMSKVHDRPHKYTPFFDGAIGAIDGTHIRINVDKVFHDDYINRHGWPSQNVVAVCDFDGWVTFLGVGMAGAVHDMRVLREAWMKPRFRHPPLDV
ncbi:unnamed protein product [Miscanthus lutarioriparius]|uniref:NB-ARC domain-containing protein n=1 Tax=Miscanthus lutarioriparius TaxID=422564 RepID=A0A811RN81_9POAL|nr:unnamed protein product [Miscanthus lutarioriparius]